MSSEIPVVITPAQLLLAIAEHETLEATCAALPGMNRERAQRLLRGIALALQRPLAPEPQGAKATAAAAANRSTAAAPKAHPQATPARAPSRPRATPTPEELERQADALLAASSGSDGPQPLRHRIPAQAIASAPALATGAAPGRVLVYSDGASRGNPGPAGAGAVVLDDQGNVLRRLGRYLGRETNNVAEYQGVLIGLRGALEMGAREVEVRADSELMIKQLKGEYRVKNEGLKPLVAEAHALLKKFARYSLRHVPREQNKLADEMSNRAIDEKM